VHDDCNKETETLSVRFRQAAQAYDPCVVFILISDGPLGRPDRRLCYESLGANTSTSATEQLVVDKIPSPASRLYSYARDERRPYSRYPHEDRRHMLRHFARI
jgi:hypothetical protein